MADDKRDLIFQNKLFKGKKKEEESCLIADMVEFSVRCLFNTYECSLQYESFGTLTFPPQVMTSCGVFFFFFSCYER